MKKITKNSAIKELFQHSQKLVEIFLNNEKNNIKNSTPSHSYLK